MTNGTQSPSAAPPTGDRRLSTLAWEDALADYTTKRHATLSLPAEGIDGEDDICSAETKAEARLVENVPAPNAEALLIKVRLAFRGHADWHPHAAYLEAIGADVNRLFPQEVARGA